MALPFLLPALGWLGKYKLFIYAGILIVALLGAYLKGRNDMALAFAKQQVEAFDEMEELRADLADSQLKLAAKQAERSEKRKTETDKLVEEGKNEAQQNAWPVGSCPITEPERRVRNDLAEQSRKLNSR